jgi:hypothetical protein
LTSLQCRSMERRKLQSRAPATSFWTRTAWHVIPDIIPTLKRHLLAESAGTVCHSKTHVMFPTCVTHTAARCEGHPPLTVPLLQNLSPDDDEQSRRSQTRNCKAAKPAETTKPQPGTCVTQPPATRTLSHTVNSAQRAVDTIAILVVTHWQRRCHQPPPRRCFLFHFRTRPLAAVLTGAQTTDTTCGPSFRQTAATG